MIIKQNNKTAGSTMDCFKGTFSPSDNADNTSDRNPPAMRLVEFTIHLSLATQELLIK